MGILCVVDGMTDEVFTFAEMLEIQKKIQTGAHGLLATTPNGIEAETTACTLTLLGMNAQQVGMAGRGWLEALGAGIPFMQEDLLCKASWVKVGKTGRIERLCIPPSGFGYKGYHHLHGWQALLVLPGLAKMRHHIQTKPPHQHIGQPIQEVLPKGCPALTEVCNAAHCEGKALVPWGLAVQGDLPAIKGAVVTATNGVKGIAHATGMELFEPAGATGDVDTNLTAKVEAALCLAEKYPFVLLHINGADEAAHRLDKKAKYTFLEKVDKALGPLINSRFPLIICADHGTSPITGRHIGTSQPFILANSEMKGDLGVLPGGEAYKLVGKKAAYG